MHFGTNLSVARRANVQQSEKLIILLLPNERKFQKQNSNEISRLTNNRDYI
jgi:hypothetical protein